MTFAEMDLSELPQTYKFCKMVEEEAVKWEFYTPTTIEADIPFGKDWWKYVYWLPLIKKEFYIMTLKEPVFEQALMDKCLGLGMDYSFFTNNYGFFIKRLKWMRANGINHIGEVES
jgi:hypothetical protein